MMPTKETRLDLEDLQYRLSCGIALVDAVRVSIDEGGNVDIEGWGRATYAATLYLNSISIELKEMIAKAYKEVTA